MPIYEYRCRACDHEFETLQKMSEPKLVDCPKCDEPALIKKISAVSFRLKGSGWYETDFKNKNQPTQHESSGDAKSESESKSKDSQDSSSKGSGSDSGSSNDTKSSKSESTASSTPSN